MPHILLTNDDGYQAEGLRALAAALEGFATVSIVAPSLERSGAAQSLTLRQPIVCNRIAEREWAIDGTPADCVIVALHKLLPEKPDMVISGINHGANLGENVYYSGTVGAAREGALHHIPSVAMSLCSKKTEVKFENSARVARAAAELILKEGLPDQVLLNVNVPEPWNGGVKFTRQSQKIRAGAVIFGCSSRESIRMWSRTRITRRFFPAPSPSLPCTSTPRTQNRSIISRTGPRRSAPRFINKARQEEREIPRFARNDGVMGCLGKEEAFHASVGMACN
jgi:5'-nucleotidase